MVEKNTCKYSCVSTIYFYDDLNALLEIDEDPQTTLDAQIHTYHGDDTLFLHNWVSRTYNEGKPCRADFIIIDVHTLIIDATKVLTKIKYSDNSINTFLEILSDNGFNTTEYFRRRVMEGECDPQSLANCIAHEFELIIGQCVHALSQGAYRYAVYHARY